MKKCWLFLTFTFSFVKVIYPLWGSTLASQQWQHKFHFTSQPIVRFFDCLWMRLQNFFLCLLVETPWKLSSSWVEKSRIWLFSCWEDLTSSSYGVVSWCNFFFLIGFKGKILKNYDAVKASQTYRLQVYYKFWLRIFCWCKFLSKGEIDVALTY